MNRKKRRALAAFTRRLENKLYVKPLKKRIMKEHPHLRDIEAFVAATNIFRGAVAKHAEGEKNG